MGGHLVFARVVRAKQTLQKVQKQTLGGGHVCKGIGQDRGLQLIGEACAGVKALIRVQLSGRVNKTGW